MIFFDFVSLPHPNTRPFIQPYKNTNMDEDDFNVNSDGDQSYNIETTRSRRQWEKRPVRLIEDDFEDEDAFGDMVDDSRGDRATSQNKKSSSGFSSASRHLQQQRQKGSGAEARRAPVDEDADQDDVEDRGPTFRTVSVCVFFFLAQCAVDFFWIICYYKDIEELLLTSCFLRFYPLLFRCLQ